MTRTEQTAHGTCTLTQDGAAFILSGPSGRHTLAVAHTSPARLDAHWAGFLSVNGGKVAAPERRVRVRLTPAQIMAVWNAATTADDDGCTGEAHQVFERVKVGATFIEGTAGEMFALCASVGSDGFHEAIPFLISTECAPHLRLLAIENARDCADRAAGKIRAALRVG